VSSTLARPGELQSPALLEAACAKDGAKAIGEHAMKPSACLCDRSGEGERRPGCGAGGEDVAFGNVLRATICIIFCDIKCLLRIRKYFAHEVMLKKAGWAQLRGTISSACLPAISQGDEPGSLSLLMNRGAAGK